MNKWLSSIHHAWKGVEFVYRHERNFRIQLVAGFLALALGWVFHISRIEYSIIFILIIAILSLELLNSALEHFLDIMTPRFDVHVERVKNVLAATVLLVSLGATVIGCIIFIPDILSFFTNK